MSGDVKLHAAAHHGSGKYYVYAFKSKPVLTCAKKHVVPHHLTYLQVSCEPLRRASTVYSPG